MELDGIKKGRFSPGVAWYDIVVTASTSQTTDFVLSR